MAPSYKLIYFDLNGAAEPIRYLFAYGKQEYEDFRIQKEEWPEFKSKTPFGKVPVLEVDGTPVAQSIAIARYLARKFNLTGKDEWEAFLADSIVDSFGDLKNEAAKAIFAPPEKAEELIQNLKQVHIPFYFGKFEEIIKKNGGFTVGSQLTWADFVLAATIPDFEKKLPGILEPFPALKDFISKVNNLPSIKAWIEKRPAGSL